MGTGRALDCRVDLLQNTESLDRLASKLADETSFPDEVALVGRIVDDWLWAPAPRPWPGNLQPEDIRDLKLRSLAQATLELKKPSLEPQDFIRQNPQRQLARTAALRAQKNFAGFEIWENLVKYVLDHTIPLDEGPWGTLAAVKAIFMANQFERQVKASGKSIRSVTELLKAYGRI